MALSVLVQQAQPAAPSIAVSLAPVVGVLCEVCAFIDQQPEEQPAVCSHCGRPL